MPRTSDVAVKAIIEVDDSISLDPFIETANELVTEVCASVTSYSSTRLELIERWLSAHFYAIRDPRRKMESAGSVRESYETQIGLMLKETTYGQQAMMLDTAGGLAALSNSAEKKRVSKVGISWLGSSQATDEGS